MNKYQWIAAVLAGLVGMLLLTPLFTLSVGFFAAIIGSILGWGALTLEEAALFGAICAWLTTASMTNNVYQQITARNLDRAIQEQKLRALTIKNSIMEGGENVDDDPGE